MLPETQCNDALVVKGATDFSIAAIMGRQSVCMDSPDKSSSKFFYFLSFFTSGFSLSLLILLILPLLPSQFPTKKRRKKNFISQSPISEETFKSDGKVLKLILLTQQYFSLQNAQQH